MAVYRKKLSNGKYSSYWHYEFVYKGKRYKGCNFIRTKQKQKNLKSRGRKIWNKLWTTELKTNMQGLKD